MTSFGKTYEEHGREAVWHWLDHRATAGKASPFRIEQVVNACVRKPMLVPAITTRLNGRINLFPTRPHVKQELEQAVRWGMLIKRGTGKARHPITYEIHPKVI